MAFNPASTRRPRRRPRHAMELVNRYRAVLLRLGCDQAWEEMKIAFNVPCICVNCLTFPYDTNYSRNALARVVRYLRSTRAA